MGFQIETSISALTVFLQGMLSFFSPCVLPLVPLYIGYLSGGAKTVNEDGTIQYKQSRVMMNTLFFVVGISFAFFLLGFGFTTVGRFFSGSRILFARIGGIIILLFGVYQLGIFGSNILGRERRLPFRLDRFSMNPLIALILGFTFSFAWTPCVGPALSSVLLMASSAASSAQGFLLIGLYTLGFVLPFLGVGLFTSTLLNFFKKHQNVVKYTVKAGGILMIFMGIMILTGWMNGITGYLSRFTVGGNGGAAPAAATSSPDPTAAANSPKPEESNAPSAEPTKEPEEELPAPDFTLVDQFGSEHTLSDYKGKVVFLNFWATWCGPCRDEMPYIQEIYEENNKNGDELIILGVANPVSEEYPFNQDKTEEEIKEFLTDHNYTYPVVMDKSGEIFGTYGITSFPTTFMIDTEGNVFGYVRGTLTKDIMEQIIEQTKSGKRP